MTQSHRVVAGLAIVVASMVVLFAAPREYFAAATFAATACMLVAAWVAGGLRPSALRLASVGVGGLTAAALYVIFLLGGAGVNALHPFGITSASESSIYSLIASPSNPVYLQFLLLLFDSAGFESFFRGTLQRRLQDRMGVSAAPAVALLDAAVHVVTLNPIWVGATFVTDLVWGLTYFYGKGLQASFTSHLLWDVAIFMVAPVA